MKLYVDMDEVLSDFEGHYLSLFGVSFGMDDKTKRWKKIDDHKTFWSHMPWMRDGKELWAALKPLNPTILSAPAWDPTCRPGKREWCKRELGPTVPVILESDKFKYAEPGAILIDDRAKNIDPWRAAGGIGILHTSKATTLYELDQILDGTTPSYSQRIKSHYSR